MYSAGRRRAKTKTFTGCWTCRKRKVKCDEARPVCRQCSSRHVVCAGYSMLLQWLEPETAETAEAACLGTKPPTMYDVAGMSMRRNMVCDEPQDVLQERELDVLLGQVEEAAPTSCGPTQNHGPFGVFLGGDGSSCPVGDVFDAIGSATPGAASGGGRDDGPVSPRSVMTGQLSAGPSLASGLMAVSPHRSISQDAAAATETPMMEALGTGETPAVVVLDEWLCGEPDGQTAAGDGADMADMADITDITDVLPDDNTEADEASGFVATPAACQMLLFPLAKPLDPMPQLDTVLPESRHLLHHYVHHVVDLMTVVPTPRGPWKTVHLPRALCGSAETELVGRTTYARNALFHALLTISAYNLAATYSTTGQELPARDWRALALRLKARTITHLKAGLQGGCPPAQRGKYKEVLAVMLSMVTIDVCSGETRTSEWHLRGLESFIRASQLEQHRRRYSGKARALHRVYVYLRIMRESTDLRVEAADEHQRKGPPGDDNGPPGDDNNSPHGTVHDQALLDHIAQPLFFLDRQPDGGFPPDWLEDVDSTPASDPQHQQPPHHPSKDLSACELVYGLPLSLLVLVGKTSELIRRQRAFARHRPAATPPPALVSLCDQLENEILEWPVDAIVAGFAFHKLLPLPIAAASRQLVEHQTRAFHQALIVYFSRLVRAVHRHHLQPYVRSIINHLDAIEVIKHSTNMASGCILWPGFIGASEALDLAIQSRYLQWFRATRFYGLGAYDKACEVVLEVWKQQKKHSRATEASAGAACDWVSVVESKDIRLMLT